MSEEDIKVLLRAIGNLEGRFTALEKKVDGVQETLAEMAQGNQHRDLAASALASRVHGLEQWKASTKETSLERRRSWRDLAGVAAGWAVAIMEAVYLFTRAHGG